MITILICNYTTTAEFGEVTKITMIVGTETGETTKELFHLVTSVTGDNLESYTLTDILDLVLGTGNTPQDAYFYVRAEMQTFIDYTGQELIRRTDFDFFHSFTNPIWIKLSDVTSAITDAELVGIIPVIGPNPFNDSFTLYLSNPEQEEVKVEMYNDIGQLIFQEVSVITDAGIEYSAKELGLSIGMYTMKVFVGEESRAIRVVKD